MKWWEVEEKYGKELAKKMKLSSYLQGITVSLIDGEVDIPISDIENAYRDVTGKPTGLMD